MAAAVALFTLTVSCSTTRESPESPSRGNALTAPSEDLYSAPPDASQPVSDGRPDEQSETAIFFTADANASDFRAVEQVIGDKHQITFVDQEDTYAEFLEFFPEMAGDPTVTAQDMPPSFRLQGQLSDAISSQVSAHPAVRAVTEPTKHEIDVLTDRSDPRHKLSVIYLHADAGDDGRDAVRGLIGNDLPGIYFVDKEETHREFLEFFDGDPDDVGEISVDLMTPSWRVDLGGAPIPMALQKELEANMFVRHVTNAVESE